MFFFDMKINEALFDQRLLAVIVLALSSDKPIRKGQYFMIFF